MIMGMVAHQFVKICPTKAPKGSPGLLSLLSLTVGSSGLHCADFADGASWNME